MADGICGAASDEVPGFLAGIRGAAAEASGGPGQEGVFPFFFGQSLRLPLLGYLFCQSLRLPLLGYFFVRV